MLVYQRVPRYQENFIGRMACSILQSAKIEVPALSALGVPKGNVAQLDAIKGLSATSPRQPI